MNLGFMTDYFIRLTPIEAIVILCIAFKCGQWVGYSRKLSEIRNSKNCPIEEIVSYQCQQSEQPNKCKKAPSDNISQNINIEVVHSPEKRREDAQSKESLPSQLLKQKVDLQMKKMQSTSFFQMRLQSSDDNKFIRKIEKHELVTDYQLSAFTENQLQLMSFKSNPFKALSEPNSLLELVAYQDHTTKVPSPLFQQKFISLTKIGDEWRHQVVAPWILENGRFNKFFKKYKYIGKGGFGSVVGAYSTLEQKQYAIKKIVIKGLLKMGDLLNQVNIISRYNHPNIVRFHTCWIQLATIDEAIKFTALVPKQLNCSSIRQQQQIMYIESNSDFTFKSGSRKSQKKSIKKVSKISNQVLQLQNAQKQKNGSVIEIYTLHIQMELCEDNLHSYLKRRSAVNQIQAFAIVNQLICGIQFLHSNGIVHRDLKPANVLLSKSLQVKICDFGLASILEQNAKCFWNERVGTPLYIAPQLNNKGPMQKEQMFLVDIYSLGVIYYELLNIFDSGTQHERNQKLCALQLNKVAITCKEFKEQKHFIKLLTKTKNRPNIFELKHSKEFQRLREKFDNI